MTRPVLAVVLAAGEGSRMKSSRPKPLHLLCGRPMLFCVLDSLADVDPQRVVVVVGHAAERVTKKAQSDSGMPLEFVEQRVQRGTGDAVGVALTAFGHDDEFDDVDDLLVMPGDQPLLRPSTIGALVARHRASGAAATLLTAFLGDPTGYGRVVRDKHGRVERIVEQKDATPEQRAITEINTSIYCFRRSLLAPALRKVEPNNALGEYYLTDTVEVLTRAGHVVDAMVVDDQSETLGVNDRVQLAQAEAALRARINEGWMRKGVTMVDPASTYIDAGVQIASDVTLFPGVILQGSTSIGKHTEVGPGTRLVDCVVGANVRLDHTTARDCEIGAGAKIGPYVHLAPGAHIADGTTVPPFTELH